ncbi:hypothetical protein [Vibrio apostichopi]|uniref:hypothetical protein n=1 Tax=Vibrio apostichopi TaxID=3035453 RepID=UPI002573D33A|nr:hypothetical protein [Vibrio sp. FE10]
MNKLNVLIATSALFSISAFAETALTTGQAPDWVSETHCMTFAKQAGLPEHELRIAPPEDAQIERFTYNLGFAEGYSKAMSIATKSTPEEAAQFLYNKQCR